MAYTPINWQTGDTITAEKMNKMDNGWSIESSAQTLCNETITTHLDGSDNVAQLTVSDTIVADVITVTYDSDVYTCNNDGGMYGAPYDDYSEYPFTFYDDGFIICETSGTHTVKVEAVVTAVEASQSFSSAVVSVSPVLQIIINKTTWQQVHDAMASGKLAYYTASVDGDEVEQYIALETFYNSEEERYEVIAVGAPIDGLSARDTIYAFSSNDKLIRD